MPSNIFFIRLWKNIREKQNFQPQCISPHAVRNNIQRTYGNWYKNKHPTFACSEHKPVVLYFPLQQTISPKVSTINNIYNSLLVRTRLTIVTLTSQFSFKIYKIYPSTKHKYFEYHPCKIISHSVFSLLKSATVGIFIRLWKNIREKQNFQPQCISPHAVRNNIQRTYGNWYKNKHPTFACSEHKPVVLYFPLQQTISPKVSTINNIYNSLLVRTRLTIVTLTSQFSFKIYKIYPSTKHKYFEYHPCKIISHSVFSLLKSIRL